MDKIKKNETLSIMKRIVALIYGIISYLIFLTTFLYAIGFVGNFIVPKSIDSGFAGAFWPSLTINILLLGLFGLQHSGMARPGFKKWWTKIVPESIERSTYVLFASLALILLYGLWQPMPAVIWDVDGQAGQMVLWIAYSLGWGLVLAATFMISHAHLFGVHQVYDNFKKQEQWEPEFQTPGLYRYMRHPLMTGFFIAFWVTPHMTVGHLLFAIVTTAYILVATLQFEERDLKNIFGQQYKDYLKQVPAFIPRPNRKAAKVDDPKKTELQQEKSQLI